MITNQSPIDYKSKRIVIVSQLVRVCLDCGSFAALLPAGWICCSCRGRNTGEVWEHDLETFRRGLAEIKAADDGMKNNPARTFGNVKMSCMDVLNYWFGASDQGENDLLAARAACIEEALDSGTLDQEMAAELLDELGGIYNELGKA